MKIKIIITTTNSDNTANDIAEYLVKEKLSPCVQITHNIQSIYSWKGKLEKSKEIVIVFKTIPKKVEDCKKLILKYHNYDTPELIITDGEILDDKYKKWFNMYC